MAKYVYVICTKDLKYKIGQSLNPISRLEQIQACCPTELELVNLICLGEVYRRKDYYNPTTSLEAMLHRHFKKLGKHLHGEWFQLCKKDLKLIADKWPNSKRA